MLVYVIKNKDNEYLNFNEWSNNNFDSLREAWLFESRELAENYLNDNSERFMGHGDSFDYELFLKDYECIIVPVEIKEIEEPSVSFTPEMLEAVKKSFANCRAIYEIPKIPKLYQHEDKGE